MPPSWRGKGSQVTGVDLESCSKRVIAATAAHAGGGSDTVSSRHYNPRATRTNQVRCTFSRTNGTASACSPSEGDLVPRGMHLGGLAPWLNAPADRIQLDDHRRAVRRCHHQPARGSQRAQACVGPPLSPSVTSAECLSPAFFVRPPQQRLDCRRRVCAARDGADRGHDHQHQRAARPKRRR